MTAHATAKAHVCQLQFVQGRLICPTATQRARLTPDFCFQVGVVEAVPRWGKNSKLVLVTLLLAGLLLAALLVAGYYLKTHRKNSKGVRLVSRWEGVCHTVGAKWLTILWLLKQQATFVFTPQTLLPSSCLSYIQMHSWGRPLFKKYPKRT